MNIPHPSAPRRPSRLLRGMAAAALALLCLSACGVTGQTADSPEQPTVSAVAPVQPGAAQDTAQPAEETGAPSAPAQDLPVEDPAETLLSCMTLEEKVGQLFFVRVPSEDAAADVATYHLGGYLLFARDISDQTADSLRHTIQSYQAAAAIPLLIGVDEEGGSVVRVSANPQLRATRFLSPQALFAGGGMDAIAADTQEKDALLRSLGFNVNLAPVADVSVDPADFIYSRTFGQDADATARYTALVTGQMSADGMGSVLKHFPGYGSNADTHTGAAVDQRPLETFVQQDFLPFQSALAAGGARTAILVSHNVMAAVDPDLPASLSPAVHDLLRSALDFDGVIMTDDLVMDAVTASVGSGEAAVLALAAGNDLLLTTDYRTQIPAVLAAVKNGTLDEGTIDAACLRALRWKQALGLVNSLIHAD